MRAVLDAKSGAQKWLDSWDERTDIAYLGTDVLVQQVDGTRTSLARFDLLTGKQRWKRTNLPDFYLTDDLISRPTFVWPATATTTGAPASTEEVDVAFRQPFGVDPGVAVELSERDKKATVVNAADGKSGVSQPVQLKADQWTVYNNLVIGPRADAPNRLVAYHLGDLKQAWEYPLPAGATFERVRPCGQQLMCVLTRPASGDQSLVAIKTQDGTKLWEQSSTSSSVNSMWSVVGDQLLVASGSSRGLSHPALTDPATGKPKRTFETMMNGTALGDVTAWAVNGAKLALVRVHAQSGGTGTVWQVAIYDTGSGKFGGLGDVGGTYPKKIVMSGTAVAVLTDEGKLLVYAVPGTR